jgi:ATP-binding cassette ChvD family protein
MSVPGKVIIAARGLRKHHGVREILSDVTFSVHQGDRLGLLGANGAGKTTLLRILAGRDSPDNGELTTARGLSVTLLDQEFRLDPKRTVREAVEGGLAHIRAWLDRLTEIDEVFAAEHPGTDHDRLLREQADLHEKVDHAGGWDLSREVEMISSALGLPPGDRTVGTLSGGEARRTALAAVLLSKPDLLLLDEPTNHLDAETVEWLEGYLAAFPGTCILVTHDRYFLDRVTNRMFELERGAVTAYTGNYSSYLEQKAERAEVAVRNEQSRQNILRRELAWIRRGAKARTTKSKGRIQRFEDLSAAGPAAEIERADFRIPTGPRLGTKVLEIRGLTKRFGNRTLFADFTLSLQPGDVLGVVGRNGLGKSTLIRIVLGGEKPDAGTVEFGVNTKMVYADQGRDRLNPNRNMVEEVSDGVPYVTIDGQMQRVETYLQKFGFEGEVQRTAIRSLSGGEQNRVQLAKMLRAGGNLLVLDEPTNDLDLNTLRVLEEAVDAFEGSAVIVSHDRYFLNRLCTHILAFEGDEQLTVYAGNYDDFRATKVRQAAAARSSVAARAKGDAPKADVAVAKPQAAAAAAATATATAAATAAAAKRKLSWTEQKELDGMDDAIAAAEAEVAGLDGLLADPTLYTDRQADIADLVRRQMAAKEKAARLYRRWEELEAARA